MRIAITGGIAEGKSTVLGYLRDEGFHVASADEIARRVFESDTVQLALASLLGHSGPVAPSEMRHALSASSGTRRAVNRLLHPLILDALERERAEFFEVPLLVETCLQGRFDRVWVVSCGPEEQLRRLTERLGDAEKATALIGLQLPTKVKCAFADEIVRTNSPEDRVKASVRAAVTREFGR